MKNLILGCSLLIFFSACDLLNKEDSLACSEIVYNGVISTNPTNSSNINVKVKLDKSKCDFYSSLDVYELYWYENDSGRIQKKFPDDVLKDGREFKIRSAPIGKRISIIASFTDTTFEAGCKYSKGDRREILVKKESQSVELDLSSNTAEAVCY